MEYIFIAFVAFWLDTLLKWWVSDFQPNHYTGKRKHPTITLEKRNRK